jgi:hypothetical protein
MEFPPTWQVFLDDFETATQLVEGMKTTKLVARVRHTGRMLGNFRIALGSEARLEVDFSCGASSDLRYPSPGNRQRDSKCVFSVLPRVGLASRINFP